MICYKDKTFCPFYFLCSEQDSCDRACTRSIEEEAMNTGMTVCMFTDIPDCFKQIDEKDLPENI